MKQMQLLKEQAGGGTAETPSSQPTPNPGNKKKTVGIKQ